MPAPRAASRPAVFRPHCQCDPETSTVRLTLQARQPPQSYRHRRPPGHRRPSPAPRGMNKLNVRKIIQKTDIELTPRPSGGERAEQLLIAGMNN